jgi:hypothetical protein
MGNDSSLPLPSVTPLDEATSASADIYDESIEPSVLLCSVDECFVYRVPPRPSAAGWRAQDWPGGLDNPWKTGMLRITGRGSDLFLCIWLKGAGDGKKVPPGAALDATTSPAAQGHLLLLQCRVPLLDERGWSFWIEPVLDSSRYFVLRLEKGTAVQLVGLGFRERNAAFELKDTIHNYLSQIKRQSLYIGQEQSSSKEGMNEVVIEKNDSILDGAQISGTTEPSLEATSPSSSRSFASLPRAPLLRPPGATKSDTVEKKEKTEESDEFGDFESAK